MNNEKINNLFPKWLRVPAMKYYFGALAIVTLLYFSHMLPWYYFLSGAVSIILFFRYGHQHLLQWNRARTQNEKQWEKKIFWTALGIRLVWMVLIYSINQLAYGDAFGFENADASFYNDLGVFVSGQLQQGNFRLYDEIVAYSRADISDMGYGIYLGFVYLFTDNSILVARLLKCVWSALTVVLMYRIAKRNFGEQTGRLTAVFCMLWPNFWYYCGCHLKETEMVFLGVLFVEQTDQMLRTRNFSAWKVIPILLISAALFTIRTPLALVTVLCLLFSVAMSSKKQMGWGKRIVIGLLAVSLIGVTMGDMIQEKTQEMIEERQEGSTQQRNMEWRGERENGNKFAKYAGAAVFAPMIFTIPFPTMVRPYDGQDVQQLLNGGNYIKNILSFFCMLAMFYFLFSGKWRNHLVPISYMLGYLIVLALSVFAQSERFHQPVMPMELMFAAYGISLALQGVPITKGIGSRKQYKKWFGYWALLMFVVCVAWNWFKLAGRGLA